MDLIDFRRTLPIHLSSIFVLPAEITAIFIEAGIAQMPAGEGNAVVRSAHCQPMTGIRLPVTNGAVRAANPTIRFLSYCSFPREKISPGLITRPCGNDTPHPAPRSRTWPPAPARQSPGW